MAEPEVFFSKHDILSVLAVHPVNVYISPKMYHIKEVLHPNWPFGVAYTVQPFMCPVCSLCFVFSK